MRDGKTHLLDGGDAAEGVVHRMHLAHIGKLCNLVELFARKRHRGRVDHERVAPAALPQRPAADGVVLLVFELGRQRVGALVGADLLIRRTLHMRIGADLRCARDERRAADICQGVYLFTARKTPRDLARGGFAHAVDQQVRLCIKNQRTAHPVVPVIIVREPAQACFQTADDDGNVTESFARTVGVDDRRTVGTQSHTSPGAV